MTISVPTDTAALAELRRELNALFEGNGVTSRTKRHMILAIDEALANIIEHSGIVEGSVVLNLQISAAEIVVSLRDDGLPFDPSIRPPPPDTRQFPKRGYGVQLIHTIADAVDYERSQGGENVLKLTKNLI